MTPILLTSWGMVKKPCKETEHLVNKNPQNFVWENIMMHKLVVLPLSDEGMGKWTPIRQKA